MLSIDTHSTQTVASLRSRIVGIDQKVPLLDGSEQTYIYLDNAASTPSFQSAQNKVNELLLYYSSIHRGAGYKSLISTQAYEKARELVIEFVGADPQKDVAIFGKNTTEATNILANSIDWKDRDVVLITLMEHHSNDLPWRKHAAVEHFPVQSDGIFDLNAFEDLLKSHKGRVRLVATTGASNVTGIIPPFYEIAKLAHRHNAMILVDCAQLAPHRPIDMRPHDSLDHLDFICLSAHKMYAPFGTGVLVGSKTFFDAAQPAFRGGGVIEVVTLDEVHWAKAPEKYEAGSPNVLGAVALGASIRELMTVGMQAIAEHEKELTHYALKRLNQIEGMRLYGSRDPDRLDDRVGVIPFTIEGVQHGKVAAIFSFEGGIGVRNGCFCAHPYLINLLNVSQQEFARFEQQVLQGDRRQQPGMVRASFGCYTNHEEIDHLITWIERIISGDYRGDYVQDKGSGSYFPRQYDPATLEKFFTL